MFSFDFGRLGLHWQLSFFVILTAIHRSVGQLNAIQPDADGEPHVVNVNEHLVVVIIDFDTIAQKSAKERKEKKKHGNFIITKFKFKNSIYSVKSD